jgi:poly(3-hydroxyalkanoate) synthetase
MTREELAREFAATHNQTIIKGLNRLSRELEKMEKLGKQ